MILASDINDRLCAVGSNLCKHTLSLPLALVIIAFILALTSVALYVWRIQR